MTRFMIACLKLLTSQAWAGERSTPIGTTKSVQVSTSTTRQTTPAPIRKAPTKHNVTNVSMKSRS